jgi:hypothetical protein
MFGTSSPASFMQFMYLMVSDSLWFLTIWSKALKIDE